MAKYSEVFPSGSSTIEGWDFSNYTADIVPMTYGTISSATVLDVDGVTSLEISTVVDTSFTSDPEIPFKIAMVANSGEIYRPTNQAQFMSVTIPNLDFTTSNVYGIALFIYNANSSPVQLADTLLSSDSGNAYGSLILLQVVPHSTIPDAYVLSGSEFRVEGGIAVAGGVSMTTTLQDELIVFGTSKIYLGMNPSLGICALEFGTRSIDWTLDLNGLEPLENFKISTGLVFTDSAITPSNISLPFNFSDSTDGRNPFQTTNIIFNLPIGIAPFKKYFAINNYPVVFYGTTVTEGDLVLFLDPIPNIFIIKNDANIVSDGGLSDKVNLIEDINLFDLSTVTNYLETSPVFYNVSNLTLIGDGYGFSFITDHTQAAYLTSGNLPITPIDAHEISIHLGADYNALNTDCTFGYLFLDHNNAGITHSEITDLVKSPFNQNNTYSGDFIFISFKMNRSSYSPAFPPNYTSTFLPSYTKLLNVISRVNGVIKSEELIFGANLSPSYFGNFNGSGSNDYLYSLKTIRIDFTNGKIIFNYNYNQTIDPFESITCSFNNNFCNKTLETNLYTVLLKDTDSVEAPYLNVGTNFNSNYNGKPLRNISKLDLSSLETGRNYRCLGYGYHDITGDNSYVMLENEDIVKFVNNTSLPIWTPIITKHVLSTKEQNANIQHIIDNNNSQNKKLLNKFLNNKVIHVAVDISNESSYNNISDLYNYTHNEYRVILLISPDVSVIEPKIIIWENGIILEYLPVMWDIFKFEYETLKDTEYKIKYIGNNVNDIPTASVYRNSLQEKQLLRSGFIIIDSSSERTTIINEIEDSITSQYTLLNDTTKVILTYGVDSDVSSYQHPKTQISFEYDEQGRLIDRQIIAIKPIASSNASKYRYIEFDDELLVPVADGSAVMIERIKFNPLSTTHLTKVSYYDIIPNTYLIKNTTTRILDLDSASEISESGLYIPYFNNNEVIFITNTEALADCTISLGCAMSGSSCKLVFKDVVTNSLVIKVLDTDPNNLIAESYTTISTLGGINHYAEIYLRVNDSGSIEII